MFYSSRMVFINCMLWSDGAGMLGWAKRAQFLGFENAPNISTCYRPKASISYSFRVNFYYSSGARAFFMGEWRITPECRQDSQQVASVRLNQHLENPSALTLSVPQLNGAFPGQHAASGDKSSHAASHPISYRKQRYQISYPIEFQLPLILISSKM